MKRYVIAYDIPANKKSNRRRTKLHNLLSGYGVRVNDSVFELSLTATAMKKLLLEVKKLITKEDNIRLYPLCASCVSKAKVFGEDDEPFMLADGFI